MDSTDMSQRRDTQLHSQSPRIPVELMDDIAHTIRTDAAESGDSETLKACSLGFSGWKVYFQSALLEVKGVCLTFSSGTTTAWRFGVAGATLDSQRKKVRALRDLLDHNPSFGKAITCLILQIVDEECLGESNSALTVASMISLLTSVRTLSFSRFDSDDLSVDSPDLRTSGSWTKFSPRLKEAIAGLFRSPSLKILTVASFDGPLDVVLPAGGEVDTLMLGAGVVPTEFFPSKEGAGTQTTDMLPGHVSTRPCIVRHLVSKPACAAHLLLAVTHLPHPHENIKTSVVDSSAIQSLNSWGNLRDSDIPGTQIVLERTTNLKKFMVYAGVATAIWDLPFSFQEPHPHCLGHRLEEIEIVFLYNGQEPGGSPDREDCPGLKRIAMELDAYPPNNILKRLTIKAYFGWRSDWLANRQELIDTSVDLARTLSTRVGSVFKFPSLQSVHLIPVVSCNEWSRQDTANLQMEGFSNDIEQVGMVLGGMNLPFSFNVQRPRLADGQSGKYAGIDRDDSRWCVSTTKDNIVELQGGRY